MTSTFKSPTRTHMGKRKYEAFSQNPNSFLATKTINPRKRKYCNGCFHSTRLHKVQPSDIKPCYLCCPRFFCIDWRKIQDQILARFPPRSGNRSVVGTHVTVYRERGKLSELSSFFSLLGIRPIVAIFGLYIALFTLRFHSTFQANRRIFDKTTFPSALSSSLKN